jgi:hypothetical protein
MSSASQTETKPKPQPYSKDKSQSWVSQAGVNYALKAKYAAYTTLVFFLIANPETYKLIQGFVGRWFTVASEGGCPTPYGFFLHAGLFFLVLWGLMLFPRDF